ncbi:MAG: alpha/beta fold hydrolase [Candidatus Protistobacter heckmanni]|nr:alpha/beta fold hydrolase [Candidatus Protistobacter heckmanni]
MQPGWIAATHHSVGLGRFALESGAHIEDCVVSCAVHGDVSDTSLPLVLGLCAIGSIHHRLDFLIGPGKALDPGRMRIVVVDALGNGLSSSPSNSSAQPGLSFPRFGIRDMVASQKAALEALDLRGAHSAGPDAVVGASMGGMQALQWAVSYPLAMRKVVALTPMARTAPWAAAVNEAARQSLLARIGADGRARPPGLWDGWTPVMQMLAMRTPAQAQAEFGGAGAMLGWLEKRSAWWAEQGFDPVDWIYQSWAYDGHDLGATPGFGGDLSKALASVRARMLIGAAGLDLYNPVEAARAAADGIPGCDYLELESDWGHLMASASDSAAAAALNARIGAFLAA